MTLTLPIEIGKRYKTREGKIVKIHSIDEMHSDKNVSNTYPINDEYGNCFTLDGFLWENETHNEDLVSNYEDKQ